MSLVYLNGEYMAPELAKISPMDRGFLFGDGVYEVIPSYQGRFVGLSLHIQRMFQGLAAIQLDCGYTESQFSDVCHKLVKENGADNLGVYIQISRGTSPVRQHGFSADLIPTIFMYTFEIPPMPDADSGKVKHYKVNIQQDVRWSNKHIKSTSLLGNVLHYQAGHNAGFDETLLFNDKDQLTEAAACNVFIVKNKTIITPELDNQKLPGITRAMLIDVIEKHSDFNIEQRIISKQEVVEADEIWLTSSSKQVAPVNQLDADKVGDGANYEVWYQIQTLFTKHLFDYA